MKGDYGIREMVEQFRAEIAYYSKMEIAGNTPYEKELHQKLMQERTEELIHTIQKYIVKAQQTIPEQETPPVEMRTFTLQELAEYNGTGGKAAYVAVNGKVYDMSEKAGWAGGSHYGLFAGNDLTGQFMSCHMGIETVLNQLPQVGTLISDV
ncbi:hypothetical protein acsn021_36320 [Anaerocolumna cellulosilytica]|uniref:Uncharacterized protein n=1 Tax=Anaerocolumna cellulosilytica TaxID=433286 RepID=A0A6S6QXX9_9FIRM|nr:cytochrome b5 domain-containing protein [Anaerocolumna cellulosilytica]MBB5195100.1 putative heme/steroid binding protein [Anaerocolumna cellulosilytica]BCJ96063.1 hypothetical protein acsn021_36320 [Anaerocolumna cellulosilytica]